MENTKKIIVTPITETITVGYKTEPVYTFDELPASVQRSLIENSDGFIMDDFVKDVPIDV